MVELARHCHLCDNQIVTLQEGTTCSLTNRKPEFNRICSRIILDKKLEQKIIEVNVKYQQIKRTQIESYFNFGLFFSISVLIIYLGYYMGKYAFEGGVISVVPLIIMSISLGTLTMAFGSLNRYNSEIKIARENKNRVDEVVEKYGVTYDINIVFDKNVHGTQHINYDLNIDKKRR